MLNFRICYLSPKFLNLYAHTVILRIDIMKLLPTYLKILLLDQRISYTLLGIVFGILFPISAMSFELIGHNLNFSFDNFLFVHSITPVMYMIDTAPIFLGLLAFFVGLSKYKVMILYKQQNKILTTDSLTGMRNRYACDTLIEQYKYSLSENFTSFNVIIINIGNLKKINNLMGLSFGNKTIIMVSTFLESICKENFDVFKINGNEFCIISKGESPKEIADIIATHYVKPIKVENLNYLIDLNIGIATSTKDCIECEDIMNHAYNAMNYHKIKQNEPYIFYENFMKPESNHIAMESKLFNALENNEYFLHYQPVVDAKTKKIMGSEALIRWNSTDFGIVSPAFFVPILEQTQLIIDVGIWAIETACKQTKIWQEQYNNMDMFISINLSINQLFDESFIEKLIKVVEKINIDKNTIRLEITESISDERRSFVRDKIIVLGENGFKLSIDDFGTGYSSLAELDSMPLYSLKVDKSFVDRIGLTANRSHVIEMIVEMSHKMGLCVVLEGVETESQYEYLRSINCDYIQGYYFSKPVNCHEFENLLSTW